MMLTLEQMTTNRINDRLNVLEYCRITMNGLRLNVCKAVDVNNTTLPENGESFSCSYWYPWLPL